MKIDRSLLEAALIGYTAEHQKLQEKINALGAAFDGTYKRRGDDCRW